MAKIQQNFYDACIPKISRSVRWGLTGTSKFLPQNLIMTGTNRYSWTSLYRNLTFNSFAFPSVPQWIRLWLMVASFYPSYAHWYVPTPPGKVHPLNQIGLPPGSGSVFSFPLSNAHPRITWHLHCALKPAPVLVGLETSPMCWDREFEGAREEMQGERKCRESHLPQWTPVVDPLLAG